MSQESERESSTVNYNVEKVLETCAKNLIKLKCKLEAKHFLVAYKNILWKMT